MTSPSLQTIKRRAAARIAERWFADATFSPLVGNPVSCRAYLSSEQELQPVGIDSVRDAKKESILYLKEELDESLIEPETKFEIDGSTYMVEAIAENDNPIIGRVIIKDAD